MNNPNEKLKLPLRTRFKKRFELGLRKKKQIIGFIVAGSILAAIISFSLTKYYRASGKIFFQYKSVNSTFLSNNGSLEGELKLLTDESLLGSCIGKLAEQNITLSLNDIFDSSEFEIDNTSAAIDVKTISDEPNKSTLIANSIIEEFSNICLLNNQSIYIAASKLITERESSLQEEIKKGLLNQLSSNISRLNLDQEQLITRISEFESELENIELDNQIYGLELEDLQKVIEKKFPTISQEILFLNDPSVNLIREKIEKMESQSILLSISQKLGGFQIQYPWAEVYDLNDLSEVDEQFSSEIVKNLKKILKDKNIENFDFLMEVSKKLFRTQIKTNTIDLTKSTIFNSITNLENLFNRIPFEIIDEARQSRIKKFNNSLVIKIKTKKLRLKEKESEYFAEIESVSRAEVPKSYFSPNIILNILFGSLAGLVIGLLLALTSTSIKIEVIKNNDDLEELEYKIISQIPSFPPGSPILFDALKQTVEKKLDPQILNSFASIETFLKYGSLDKSLKTVLITSSQDGEGKSVIASNVAIALANSGNNVLLVDADLKHPQLNKFFKVKSTPSLAHYLFRKKDLNEIIRSTHNKNLDLITCIEFPQNPAVIITSERMKNFMEEVRNRYDYIIYDSGSLTSLKETAKMAKKIDEVILLVRANKTKLSELMNAESIFDEYGVSEFTVILNDVKSS